MTDHDRWLGYLVSVIINETHLQSIECCPGCADMMISPLLHSHHHSNLLEKLYAYLPCVKELILPKMKFLVEEYVSKFPDPEIYDDPGKKVLRCFGKDFILQSTPTSVYYSHFLKPEIDRVINTPMKLRMKPMNYKRVAKKLKNI